MILTQILETKKRDDNIKTIYERPPRAKGY
jgi:hypothetical protein